MDRRVLDYLARKMNIEYEDDRDGRRGVRGSGRNRRDYADYDDYADRRDRRDRRARRGNRRDYADYEDYADYADYADYGEDKMRLSKSDIHKWKKMLENFDGSHGEHYNAEQIDQVAQKMNINFDEFNEREFCICVNMMYADYGHVIKKYLPPERELHFCAELAKAFLEDKDGPEPSEKLALYYHCIVNHENTF